MAAVEDLQRDDFEHDQRDQDDQQAAAEQGAREHPLDDAGYAGRRGNVHVRASFSGAAARLAPSPDAAPLQAASAFRTSPARNRLPQIRTRAAPSFDAIARSASTTVGPGRAMPSAAATIAPTSAAMYWPGSATAQTEATC